MTQTSRMLIGLALALGVAGEAQAQIFDGQYWEATISGKTRVVLIEPDASLAEAELVNGRLSKTTFYLLSSWDVMNEVYTLDAWTTAAGTWVRADDAGTMLVFGEGFPDSKDAVLDLTVNLTPTPPGREGGSSDVIIETAGLIRLKFKTDKKSEDSPGISEVQALETGGGTAGDFTLTFDGATTALLPFNVTAGALQTALQGLPNIGAGNLLVQQPAAGSFLLTFAGSLSLQDVSQILVDTDTTTGGTGVFTTVVTPGMSPVLKSLKNASFKLLGVGSEMSSQDFAAEGNRMIGNPKIKAKRITVSGLPFEP